MPCIVKKTVEIVLEAGSELLVQVKGNQAKLKQAIETYSKQYHADETVRRIEIGKRNREEKRQVQIWALPQGFGEHAWHGHFKTLIKVTRATDHFDTKCKNWKTGQEATSYYLATCTGSALFFANAIRNHWSVENRLHYVLDVTFDEDASRIRRNPGVFAGLRKMGGNLLRFNGEHNMSIALYANAINLDRLLRYKGI